MQEMPEPICQHCGSAIVHRETEIIEGGKTFCCGNCAAAGGTNASMGTSVCEHCRAPIVWRETIAIRADQTFCCENCADAMEAKTTRGSRA